MSNERANVGSGQQGGGFYRRLAACTAPVLLALAALAPMQSCNSVPITHRRQLNMFSIADDKHYGAEAYADVMKKSKLKDSGEEYAQVKRVVSRLIPVVDDPGFEWEFHVIDDPQTVNAWCMPGGKIAVYTGILPVTKNDAALAVVLGHEIGHAIARHGTERMTSQKMSDATLGALSAFSKTAAEYQDAIAQVTGLLVLQPWGRDQELEADHIGLIYMARAGYDPREAVDFWKRMAAQSHGAPPELLSTHPSDAHRIQQIEKLMPEALKAYEATQPHP